MKNKSTTAARVTARRRTTGKGQARTTTPGTRRCATPSVRQRAFACEQSDGTAATPSATIEDAANRMLCEIAMLAGDAAVPAHLRAAAAGLAFDVAATSGTAYLASHLDDALGAKTAEAFGAIIERFISEWQAAQVAASVPAVAPRAAAVAQPAPVVDTPPVVELVEPPMPAASAPPAVPGVPSGRVADDLAALQADPELSGMFFSEALDHLSSIEAIVLQLEASPDDNKLLNDIFRPFHTVKGNAGALGVTTLQELAHKVENLLDLCRSGRHVMGPDETDAVLKAVDLLTALINDFQQRLAGQPGSDLEPERQALMAVVDGLVQGAGTGAPVPAAPRSTAVVPPPSANAPVASPVVTQSNVAPTAPAAASADADHSPRATTPAKRVDDASAQTSVKVDTRKLDNLVDMVGELVIVQSIINADPTLSRVASESLGRNLGQLQRITSELQRTAMSMRMVPIRQTFQKMARLVRDLSKKSGKNVDLVLSGEDTELDRRVVEDINDPLMHMVRNSMDHGIEDAARRAASGKRPEGRLSLSAYHQGGNIVIAIADDGAGLNTEKILAKAVSQGLVPAGTNLPPAEIFQLIFKAGFSTADKVTEISGRGVGMDVVKRNIEALRGRVDIQSTLGEGTTFYIKLPLTLAILDGLVLGVGGQRYVMPTFSVRESLRPTREQVHTVQGHPRMIQVRDRLIPLVRLSDLFGLSHNAPNPWDATVVVIEDDGHQLGLVVDDLLGKQEVVIKSLGEAFTEVQGVAGGAILGDGRVGLILDAHGIVGRTRGDRALAA